MEHNFYYVINQEIDGLYYAYVETVKGSENLLGFMERLKDAISVNAVKTRKEAENIAYMWNQTYKENGTNLL